MALRDRRQTSQPEVNAVRIEVLSLDNRSAAELRLHLHIDNPGEALTLREAALEWLLDDQTFAHSRHRLDATCAAHQDSEQAIDISLAYQTLPFAEFPGRARLIEDFKLVVRGELRAESGGRRAVAMPFVGQTALARPKDR
jgi:hypothetical protein